MGVLRREGWISYDKVEEQDFYKQASTASLVLVARRVREKAVAHSAIGHIAEAEPPPRSGAQPSAT
jgi:hypothetical protein